jgi:hypothetical protein
MRVGEVESSGAESPRRAFQTLSSAKRRGSVEATGVTSCATLGEALDGVGADVVPAGAPAEGVPVGAGDDVPVRRAGVVVPRGRVGDVRLRVVTVCLARLCRPVVFFFAFARVCAFALLAALPEQRDPCTQAD